MHGSHLIDSCSSTQSIVALSSAEAELNAIVKSAAEILGVMNLMKECGCEVTGKIFTDSSAARGIVQRQGKSQTPGVPPTLSARSDVAKRDHVSKDSTRAESCRCPNASLDHQGWAKTLSRHRSRKVQRELIKSPSEGSPSEVIGGYSKSHQRKFPYSKSCARQALHRLLRHPSWFPAG